MMKTLFRMLTICMIAITVSMGTLKAQTDSKPVTAKDFSCFYASWYADYDAFDKGCYGLGWLMLNDAGWGGTYSVHGNWGIVDDGNVSFYAGPAYGYVIHPNILLLGQLRAYVYSYDKPNEKGGSDLKIKGGAFLAPGARFQFGKISLGAAFNFGWVKDCDDLAKNVEITIGYHPNW